jgi:hypothetical protein
MKKTKQLNPLKRTIIVAALMIAAISPSYSQVGVGINSTGAPANGSAMLDVSSIVKGALLPRMSSSDRLGIGSPAIGLTVYQTDAPEGYYYNSSAGWIKLSTTVGTVTGVTASSPLSSTGGAAPDISLSGTVGVANGGTGTSSTLSGYVKGGSPMTAVATIPGADITGTVGNATNAVNFTGSLSGDVTGTQGATVVGTVGGVSAANVASGANAANAATDVNLPSIIVKRDFSGNFSAGTITANLTGNVTGNVSGTAANVTGIVAVANGGTGTGSTLSGYLKGGSPITSSATVPTTDLSGTISNGQLANSSINVNAGTGLSGGGAVSLGGSTTLSNAGVLSVSGTSPISSSGGQNPVISLGALGQSSVTVLSTASTAAGTASGVWTPIPGLTQNVNVPTGSAVLVDYDVYCANGLATANAAITVDYRLFIDGVQQAFPVTRVCVHNSSNFTGLWMPGHMTCTYILSPGVHTIDVRTGQATTTLNTVAAGVGSVLQSSLTVTMIKQ